MIFAAISLVLSAVLAAQGAAYSVRPGTGEVSAGLVERVDRVVGERLAALRPEFPGLVPAPFTVVLHGRAEDLPPDLQRARHAGAPGFALLGRHEVHLIVDDMRRSGAKLEDVVAHELVHELLDQYAGPSGRFVPRWFHEGLAQHLAGDTYLGAREEDLVWRIGLYRLPSFEELRTDFPPDEEGLRVAYAKSYSFVSWLVREFGLGTVIGLAKRVDDHTSLERALVMATQRTTLELDDSWRNYLRFGSGAWWRVLFAQCFDLLMLLSLPALLIAVLRRRARARAIGRRMAEREAMFPHEFELEQRATEPAQDPGEGIGAPPPEAR
ncbi:MAG: hypothetical protein U1E73_02260 [Planctomycetota bacterium]